MSCLTRKEFYRLMDVHPELYYQLYINYNDNSIWCDGATRFNDERDDVGGVSFIVSTFTSEFDDFRLHQDKVGKLYDKFDKWLLIHLNSVRLPTQVKT